MTNTRSVTWRGYSSVTRTVRMSCAIQSCHTPLSDVTIRGAMSHRINQCDDRRRLRMTRRQQSPMINIIGPKALLFHSAPDEDKDGSRARSAPRLQPINSRLGNARLRSAGLGSGGFGNGGLGNRGFGNANGHERHGARSSGVTHCHCGRPATEPLSSTPHSQHRRSIAFMQGWQSIVHYDGKFVAKGLTKRCRSPMIGDANCRG